MSVSILVVDNEPDWLSFFGSGFVVRPVRARMFCIRLRGGGIGSARR
jgi:hypothetical protein